MLFLIKDMRFLYSTILLLSCVVGLAQEKGGLLISPCELPSVANHDSVQQILNQDLGPRYDGPRGILIVRYTVDADAQILSQRILRAPHPAIAAYAEPLIELLRFTSDACFRAYVRQDSPEGIGVNVPFQIGLFP
ncbi:MAG: hypothetical protein AAF206_02330 [Bacteroidota bacterium]